MSAPNNLWKTGAGTQVQPCLICFSGRENFQRPADLASKRVVVVFGSARVNLPSMTQHDSPESEIIECEARLRDAQLASNVAQLDELIADDLLFVDMSGQLATKAMDLEAHRSGTLRLTQSELKEQQIRCLSDAVAVAVAKIALVGTYAGDQFSGEFRYTRVWQKRRQGWQIVAGHMSALS